MHIIGCMTVWSVQALALSLSAPVRVLCVCVAPFASAPHLLCLFCILNSNDIE